MIPIEVSGKPWWGPRARARKFLVERTAILPPAEALRAVGRMLGDLATGIQHARFIDFVHRGEGFRYTLMLLWTDSDPLLREAVYDLAPQAVFETGWYPLPMGERLSSVQGRRTFRSGMSDVATSLPSIGKELRSIESAVPVSSEGGCSIRIRTEAGNILLDSGLPGRLQLDPADRVLLLSHTHSDHSGGLSACVDAGMTVVASAETLQGVAEWDSTFFAAHRHAFRVAEPEVPSDCGGVVVIPFAVPHCPGSLGFEVRGKRQSVFFTGDICLRSLRHDFLSDLAERVRSSPVLSKTLLLDATMAGRSTGASRTDAAASLLAVASTGTDTLLTSQIPEHLCYAYFDLFHRIASGPQRHQFNFLLSGRLRPAMRLLHASFIDRIEGSVDRFLDAQYGPKRQAWGESRWCYWLDHLKRLPEDGRPRIYFVPQADLDGVPPIQRGLVVHIGRGSTPEDLISTGRWTETAIDTSPWTAHSDSATLVEAMVSLKEFCRVILFHDFPGRLRKFIKRTGGAEDVLTEASLVVSSEQA